MEITLDYVKAEYQAECLEQCAGDLLRQSRDVNVIISDVRRAWQGDTADVYIKKLIALEDELRANADKCSKDAADFRARIKAFKKADEDAKAVIESG